VNVHDLLSQYGYAAVFVLVGLESLGVPLPGETILIAAGIYAGTTHKLSIWVVFAVAAAGAIIGDNLGFLIGDKGGYRLLRRYGGYVRADEAKIKVGRYIFDRHGAKVVFFGRFVSVLRTYAAFLAGTLKMHWRRFLCHNSAGGIVWSAIYAFGPYRDRNRIGPHLRHCGALQHDGRSGWPASLRTPSRWPCTPPYPAASLASSGPLMVARLLFALSVSARRASLVSQ
jgi:membrane protein DedA with SNARE-associated domain